MKLQLNRCYNSVEELQQEFYRLQAFVRRSHELKAASRVGIGSPSGRIPTAGPEVGTMHDELFELTEQRSRLLNMQGNLATFGNLPRVLKLRRDVEALDKELSKKQDVAAKKLATVAEQQAAPAFKKLVTDLRAELVQNLGEQVSKVDPTFWLAANLPSGTVHSAYFHLNDLRDDNGFTHHDFYLVFSQFDRVGVTRYGVSVTSQFVLPTHLRFQTVTSSLTSLGEAAQKLLTDNQFATALLPRKAPPAAVAHAKFAGTEISKVTTSADGALDIALDPEQVASKKDADEVAEAIHAQLRSILASHGSHLHASAAGSAILRKVRQSGSEWHVIFRFGQLGAGGAFALTAGQRKALEMLGFDDSKLDQLERHLDQLEPAGLDAA